MSNKWHFVIQTVFTALLTVAATDVGVSSLEVRAYRNSTSDGDALRYKRQLSLDDGDADLGGLFKREAAPVVRGGINWGRHGGKSYVRFVLAESVLHPHNDSTPVAIQIGNCNDWPAGKFMDENNDANLGLYNKVPLETGFLSTEPKIARLCQTFFASDASPAEFNPALGHCTGWPVAVTIANYTSSPIGWNATTAVKSCGGNLKWVTKVDMSDPKDHIIVDCRRGWWREHEAFFGNRPQFYGKSCRLRIHDRTIQPSARLCITAGSKDLSQLNGKPLKYEPCTKNNPAQEWHIQSTALEWPNYIKTGVHGFAFDKNPRDAYKCSPHCLEQRG